jgi:hypothetical protein
MEIIDLTGDDEARVETTTKLEAREVLTKTLSKVSAVWENTENKPVVAALAFFSLVGLVALEGVLKGILVTSSRAVDKLVPSLLQLIGTGYIAVRPLLLLSLLSLSSLIGQRSWPMLQPPPRLSRFNRFPSA